ncbi:hypothetical protein ACSQ67_013208 [Phaseolus vulgaris]
MTPFRELIFPFFFIVLSLLSIGNVQASRKLVAATLPNMGNSPVPVIYPPFPPITDWPEYRLPPPFSPVPPTLPPFSSVPPTVPPFSPVPPTITNP